MSPSQLTYPHARLLDNNVCHTEGHLPTVDVISSQALPKDVSVTHVPTDIHFRRHVQVTACFLAHICLWHVSQTGDSGSAERCCIHEPGGVRVDEPAGTASRVSSAHGGGISSLKTRTCLTQSPGHGSRSAWQVGDGPSIYFSCHGSIKCCLQGAVKQRKEKKNEEITRLWFTKTKMQDDRKG